MEGWVVRLRERRGWGARKLRVMLLERGIDLPVRTIHRILVRHGLVFPRVRDCSATVRFEREHPNELWQMDFKGEYPLGDGSLCYPLTVLDDHSRFVVGLQGLTDQQGESVYGSLVKVFGEYGVPEEMLMDHGTPWWSNTNGYGLTWVAVKLIRQGIRLHFGRFRHPQTQGKVERFHRTLKAGLRHRGIPSVRSEWEPVLSNFRYEYNNVRPHEALQMTPPASRYQPSQKAYTPNPPEWEYPEGALVKRLNTQGCLTHDRHRYFVSEALAGEQVQIDAVDHLLLVQYRNTYVREINTKTKTTKPLIEPKNNL
jgi:transposase InsO family protein